MFKLNLKIALRNLYSNKLYTCVNILGLTIGMTGCILIFTFIKFQQSYDRHFNNGDRIYRFVTDWKYNNFDDYSSGVPFPFAPAAQAELAGIEKIARISRNSGVIIVKDGEGTIKYKANRELYFVEPALFDILQVNWVSGKSNNVLSAPNTVVLSEKTSKLLFGSAKEAENKIVTLWNSVPLRVVGIFKDIPSSSSVPMEIMASFSTFWGNKNQDWESVSSYNQCFALLSKDASVTTFNHSLKKLSNKYLQQKKLPGQQQYKLQALKDIHFSQQYSNFADTAVTRNDVFGLGLIAIFLMTSACINFINLATAQSVNRGKEVGVRKVMGAIRPQLVIQFLTETILITASSMIIACIFSELALSPLSSFLKVPISSALSLNVEMASFLVILLIVVSALAGFYPALILSGLNPVSALKNRIRIQTGIISFRTLLIVAQFAVTVILIIGTLMVIRQMNYMREKPLGFEKDHIMLINFPGDSASLSHQQLFRNKMSQVKGIKMLSFFARPPLSGLMNTTNFYIDGRENKDFEVRLSMSDEHYFDLFALEFIAGKVYGKSDTANAYITNETFIKKIGISDPPLALGKIISQNGRTGPIVGIVKDFNDQSLKEQISPMIFYQEKRQYYSMGIKLDQSQIQNTKKEIEAIWTNMFPNEIYNAKFIDDDIQQYYESERITGILLTTFGALIMFIAFIGLFGLVSFIAAQRSREVAIRKILGASNLELVTMLNGSFIKLVLIANVIAWPLAYVLVSKWLANFAYRSSISIWPFVFAVTASLLITLIIVTLRSYRVANANAVSVLKYE